MVDASATPPRVRLTTFLSHEASSASVSLNNIQFSENIGGGLQAYWTSSFVPGFTASGVSITGRTDVLYAPSAALCECVYVCVCVLFLRVLCGVDSGYFSVLPSIIS